MLKSIPLTFVLCVFLPAYAAFAQSETEDHAVSGGDFWICIGADTAFYSVSGLSWGGSVALGYGTGSSIGLKVTWFFSEDAIETLELSFILRFYLQGASAYSGPYLQLMGGPSLFNHAGSFSLPSSMGMISAGLCFGWRFLFLDRWFVEPVIRGGYPYIAGAGVSAGVRF